MASVDRRDFLVRSALGSLAFSVGGYELLLSPAQARSAGASLRTLTMHEAETIGALGETLLPGAREAGIAHYVDQQISVAPEQCLLILPFLEYHPPYAPFYRSGLETLDNASRRGYRRPFIDLSASQRAALVRAQRQKDPLFYLASQADAVDVVYGTVEGFKRLGIPYMPHVAPTRRW